MSERSPEHVVVIGASAGGVEALKELAAGLEPGGPPRAYFVVLHILASGSSVLPAILDRASKLPALAAVDGVEIEADHIYVAPPDHHMLIEDRRVRLTRGPRENGHRPAVDPLFRSAADAYGPETVGIVLSGSLDDGTAGLGAVKAAGGTTIVQDPAEALYDGMPRSAIAATAVDHVASVRDMPALIESALEQDPPVDAARPIGDDRDWMGELSEQTVQTEPASGFTCPECGGALWEREVGDVIQFRCRVGHSYSPVSLVDEQEKSLENALWTAVRTLEERVSLLLRMAARVRGDAPKSALRFERAAGDAEMRAGLIREAIVAMSGQVPAQAAENAVASDSALG